MTKGGIFIRYQHLSPRDRRAFDPWLRAGAVAGVLLALAVVAVAVNGSGTPGPSAAPATRAQTSTFQELHGVAHRDNLSVDHLDNQALIFTAPERETRQ
jgi:hypothetical protein